MSDNTQVQGRNFFTERNFTFNPYVGDDAIRTNLRWEMDLQRQLYIGDVTKDGAAKTEALNAPYIKPLVLELSDGIGALALTQTSAASVEIAVLDSDADVGIATTGSVPTGMTVSVGEGNVVVLSGTPTGLGSFAFTVLLLAEGYTDASIPVAGNVTAPPA